MKVFRTFKKRILLISALLAFTSLGVQAKVKISKINYSSENQMGVVTINLEGNLKDTPELMIRNNLVQISIPNSYVWPKIEKRISINKSYDSNVVAYQFNKDLVRIRATLPYNLKGKEGLVSIELGENNIKLFFPMIKTTSQNIVKALLKKNKKKKRNVAKYDEGYLAKLLKDKSLTKNKVNGTKTKSFLDDNKEIEDRVTSKMSSVSKTDFSYFTYIAKFVGFFSILVAGMYFLINFFRKGMLKKGGLGFLSGTKMVDVISTTYLGPKRSLLIVKVHKQVFLLSQSEKGMDFLTEITDTAQFFKEGEKQVVGDNFDTNLFDANSKGRDFKLKEVVSELSSNKPIVDRTDFALGAFEQEELKDKVSLSKQIKNKLKELKPLQ